VRELLFFLLLRQLLSFIRYRICCTFLVDTICISTDQRVVVLLLWLWTTPLFRREHALDTSLAAVVARQSTTARGVFRATELTRFVLTHVLKPLEHIRCTTTTITTTLLPLLIITLTVVT